MYNVGDYVVYGMQGACKVKDITQVDFSDVKSYIMSWFLKAIRMPKSLFLQQMVKKRCAT